MVCSQTKAKAAALNRERGATGGGPKVEEEMGLQEGRIVGIMGEVCVKGIMGGFDTADTAKDYDAEQEIGKNNYQCVEQKHCSELTCLKSK